MTWLALAPWQAWTLAAATAAAVTWLFLLKLRHPRRAVPSLVLWARALEQERPRSIVERLRRLVSLVVILVVAWLLALAPGRPAWVATGARPRPITLVIDTSPSMATTTIDGRTRLDLAKRRARDFIASAGPAPRVRLIDTAGRVSAPAGLPPSELRRTLDGIAVWPGADRLPRFAPDERDLLVVSDGVRRRPWPPQAARVSVFEPAVNVAIAAFDVRSIPAQPLAYEAYIEIVNDSPGPQRADLSIRDAEQIRLRRAIDLAAGGRYRDIFAVAGFARGEIRATVAARGDAFAMDDAAVAYLPATRPIKTLLVTDGHPPLETALGLDPLLDLTAVRPSRFTGGEGADVVVFDRFVPASPPAEPALLFHPTAAAWLDPVVRVSGEVRRPTIRTWDQAHPLLRFVSGADIRIDRTARLEVAPAAAGVAHPATAEETPLVVAEDRPVRRVLVGFDLRDTDFPFQVGFPLFLRNAITWLAGIRDPLRAPVGEVHVPWPGAAITTAAGSPVSARRVLEATVFDAPAPGLFWAEQGGGRVPVLVNAGGSAGNVNASEFAAAAPGEPPAPAGGDRELWPAMLAIAFVLVTLEWVTFHRRITV